MNQNVEVIKEQTRKCFVGNKEVPCPDREQQLNSKQQTISWERRFLPEGLMKDERNNMVFASVLLGVIVTILVLAVLKVRIFGKTLVEYIKPIWFYVLGAVLVVLSQYLIVLPYNDKLPYLANISQALWALMVALSVIKLSKEEDFSLGNAFFLGVIYSVVIHGTKVVIRYLFYERTLFYVVDRFIYGSLLVMLIVVILGPVFILLRNRNVQY